MKLSKKYLTIFLLGLLPLTIFTSGILADQHFISFSPAIVSEPTSVAITTLAPQNSQELPVPPAIPMSSLTDIAHNNHADFSNWLKPDQAKQILSKAKQSGQLNYVMTKLQSMQLPKSLALIPVIESHYTTGAISNKGASGIWQLMPVTAKRFGLNKGQRYQLAASTDAALRYFKTLHQKFGNWEFAIAAYNAGEGRIMKALSKNPNAVNVQQLNLPKETKQYVQKFYMLEDYASNGSMGITA